MCLTEIAGITQNNFVLIFFFPPRYGFPLFYRIDTARKYGMRYFPSIITLQIIILLFPQSNHKIRCMVINKTVNKPEERIPGIDQLCRAKGIRIQIHRPAYPTRTAEWFKKGRPEINQRRVRKKNTNIRIPSYARRKDQTKTVQQTDQQPDQFIIPVVNRFQFMN